MHPANAKLLDALIDMIAESGEPPLEAAERMVKDAKRYRWLRDKSLGQYQHPIAVQQRRVERGMQYIGPLCGEALDKEMDVAMHAVIEGKA